MIKGKKHTSSRLRHRLSLQQEIQTPDGAGGTSKSWEDVATLWAEIIPVAPGSATGARSGKEQLFANQIQADVTHRILLRYREGVTAAMRLMFETRIFNILSVVNTDESDATLELLVQEGVAT